VARVARHRKDPTPLASAASQSSSRLARAGDTDDIRRAEAACRGSAPSWATTQGRTSATLDPNCKPVSSASAPNRNDTARRRTQLITSDMGNGRFGPLRQQDRDLILATDTRAAAHWTAIGLLHATPVGVLRSRPVFVLHSSATRASSPAWRPQTARAILKSGGTCQRWVAQSSRYRSVGSTSLPKASGRSARASCVAGTSGSTVAHTSPMLLEDAPNAMRCDDCATLMCSVSRADTRRRHPSQRRTVVRGRVFFQRQEETVEMRRHRRRLAFDGSIDSARLVSVSSTPTRLLA